MKLKLPVALFLCACAQDSLIDDAAETDTDTTADVDTEAEIDTEADTEADTEETQTLSDYERCFAHLTDQAPTDAPAPDYEQFDPIIASHCAGTNHQDIRDIERVVFIGDSVTVGTPPTETQDYYRTRLAHTLAGEFGLATGWDHFAWENVDVFSGTTINRTSGDFASCAEWGARADDLMRDGDQLEDCFPTSERNKRTLVVMTVGGNDLNSLTQGFMEGKSDEELWEETQEFMGLMRQSVEWLKDPERFPAGVDVIFSNLYEFTDGTGDVTSCPTAGLAGYGEAVSNPALAEMVVWSMEQYMSIAVDTQSDMLFLLETFCGHGFNRDNPEARCYSPGNELWFDLTCIHPNPAGHAAIADMFADVVAE